MNKTTRSNTHLYAWLILSVLQLFAIVPLKSQNHIGLPNHSFIGSFHRKSHFENTMELLEIKKDSVFTITILSIPALDTIYFNEGNYWVIEDSNKTKHPYLHLLTKDAQKVSPLARVAWPLDQGEDIIPFWNRHDVFLHKRINGDLDDGYHGAPLVRTNTCLRSTSKK